MSKITLKKIIWFFGLFVLLAALLLSLSAYRSFRWHQAAKAAGGLPYQIGLTNVIIMKCFTTVIPPVCAGGILCSTLDIGRCNLYSEVIGTPAGGTGINALFLDMAIAQAGLTIGGQLIAGGLAPVAMDSGVLASAGGCYGCGLAKAGWTDKFFNWLDKYIIAGFKEK